MGNPQPNTMPIVPPFGVSELEGFAWHHSAHPTFQQILDEVSHVPLNATLGLHEFNEMPRAVRLAPIATHPIKNSKSLTKAGTIFANDDIIYSTLLDGPYRHARSKPTPSPNH
ncbi:hypothetical protein L0F63_001979 [Massospora cicadina]|nr:hypothetical protein L0F63_001979 [Massospora cicadina]